MERTTRLTPATHEEWLEIRKQGIGSSEIATIVGLNGYEDPYIYWQRKTGQIPPVEENFAMKAGHYLEDAVARFFADATGYEIIEASKGDWILRLNEKPFLQASPDRTFWLGASRSPYEKGICECKTTRATINPDDLPKMWFAQLQYQLGIAGYQKGALAWLTSGHTFGYQMFDYSEKVFTWLAEEAERFYKDNIIGGQAPQPITAAGALAKYAKHTDGKILCLEDLDKDEEKLGTAIFEACRDLAQVNRELKALNTRKDELEEKIKLVFGDNEAISWSGEVLATWKAAKDSQKFDAKAFQADHPDEAAPYMKTVAGSRRFICK